MVSCCLICFFFFQAEDGIRDWSVTGVQTCALPISIRQADSCNAYTVADPSWSPRGTTPGSPESFSGHSAFASRSEERRVGKECRSRWTTYHYKKKNKNSEV